MLSRKGISWMGCLDFDLELSNAVIIFERYASIISFPLSKISKYKIIKSLIFKFQSNHSPK